MNSKDKDLDFAKYLFHEGTNYRSYQFLGSFLNGEDCIFRVWAPNAKRAWVTGDFCAWKNDVLLMNKVSDGGIYELEVHGVKEFDCYKYVFETEDGRIIYKADPYARHFETRPGTASKVYNTDDYIWKDKNWMQRRKAPYDKPMNIYELHLGSWRKYEDENFFNYQKMAEEIVAYVKEMGYTHVELLPVSEHPYDKSWGYQVTGYYAPSSRYGTPKDFMAFVDYFHRHGIGVILDWVPGHFPKDESGLADFDGGSVYEYSDPLKREHGEWGTRVFDFGKKEVECFLVSNAAFWFDKYHVDGLRVDAVSSMVYLNYGRTDGNWRANEEGGIINLECINMLRRLNIYVFGAFKGIMMIAEESTTYPNVTKPVFEGGLGFNFKWNMGWMNDSLKYMKTDPFFKKDMHNCITFSMTYAFAENFILAISHDEVVHGKGSLLSKMPGDYAEKFANLRTFLIYMYTHPGKKLLFMGSEIAQFIEWNEETELDWNLLEFESHRKHKDFVRDLNYFYKDTPALWEIDYGWDGFNWNTVDDRENNVIAYTRKGTGEQEYLIVCHFSSRLLKDYKIGVDGKENYKQILSSDEEKYGGSGINNNLVKTCKKEYNGHDHYISITVPAFTAMIFRRSLRRRKPSKKINGKISPKNGAKPLK